MYWKAIRSVEACVACKVQMLYLYVQRKASNNFSHVSPWEERRHSSNRKCQKQNSKTKQVTIPFLCGANHGDQTEIVLARLIAVDKNLNIVISSVR